MFDVEHLGHTDSKKMKITVFSPPRNTVQDIVKYVLGPLGLRLFTHSLNSDYHSLGVGHGPRLGDTVVNTRLDS